MTPVPETAAQMRPARRPRDRFVRIAKNAEPAEIANAIDNFGRA